MQFSNFRAQAANDLGNMKTLGLFFFLFVSICCLQDCLGLGARPPTDQPSPVHTTPEEFENATISGHFAFVFE